MFIKEFSLLIRLKPVLHTEADVEVPRFTSDLNLESCMGMGTAGKAGWGQTLR